MAAMKDPNTVTVAVVGLGAMGRRLAGRLLEAGYCTIVWNRTPSKAEALIAAGALPAKTPRDAAAEAEIVVTMVADPWALEAISHGADGIAAGAHDALTVIEMSTVGPAALARFADTLPVSTCVVDAPVVGSLAEAEAGSLTIFVGGAESHVRHCYPLLSVLGRPIHVGESGAGAAAKLVANMAIFGTLVTLGEALALADTLGVRRETAFAVLASTPLAQQAERRREAIEAAEYPRRFSLALARKDADLIIDAAQAAGLHLPAAAAARTWLLEAEGDGFGRRDYTAVLARILKATTRTDSSPPP
jgi:3-hydroxyisobutyrate dehydrogenase-like beta-hydroxyacid dehydrogenase